jgi:protein SCO1
VNTRSLQRMFLVAALVCPTLAPAYAAQAQTFDAQAALKLSQAAVGRTPGDYTLVDAQGRAHRLASYRGKPLLVNFIYTGCFKVCPTSTRTLKRAVDAAQSLFGPNAFHAVSIGFNLPFDTPDALGAFARQQDAVRSGWDFVSPEPASLAALTRDFGFSYRPSPRGFDHVLQITIVDAGGRIYRQIYGDDFTVPQVVGPLRELLTGAPSADASLAGLLDRVRILCTAYDPASGTYRVKYSIVFELAGGLASLTAIAWFFWRELRRSRAA